MLGNEHEYVLSALESTWISGGPFVERLEREMAERMGVRYAVAVANGTAALHLTYLALGIGPGDEVIVPGFTFAAVAAMARAVGAKVVTADVDAETWLLDPDSVASLVGPRTKAIVPVHLYGNVSDMDALMEVGARSGVAVVEDAAEAAFSRYKGKYAGTIGTAGTLSFHATKTITTGAGGMVLTNDAPLAERMRMIRDHGMRHRSHYWHEVVGFNFRLTNLQAALGCAQLERLEHILAERQRVQDTYRRQLDGDTRWRLQLFRLDVEPVLWTFALQLVDAAEMPPRDVVIERMAAGEIETRPGFFALSEFPPYRDLPDLPNSLAVAQRVLTLPTYPGLEEDTIAHICAAFRSALEG